VKKIWKRDRRKYGKETGENMEKRQDNYISTLYNTKNTMVNKLSVQSQKPATMLTFGMFFTP
jgi:hypothetical protein